MNQDERHPIDDTPEPGAYSTLGYLHHECENYAEARDKVIAAETSLKAAEQVLLQARLEFTWAKRNLTEAIDKAYLVSHACDGRRTEAPSKAPDPFEAGEPGIVPEGAKPLEGMNPCVELPARDFDANDTAYDASDHPF